MPDEKKCSAAAQQHNEVKKKKSRKEEKEKEKRTRGIIGMRRRAPTQPDATYVRTYSEPTRKAKGGYGMRALVSDVCTADHALPPSIPHSRASKQASDKSAG
jgi:hypothetical protein